MVFQYAPQTVIAVYHHPVAGDWLWLDDGKCGFGSWAAEHWTAQEPDEAEIAARKDRAATLAAESAAAYPAFMPSEGMITRPHDAAWGRLERGRQVTVSAGGWSRARMRVTDVIAHVDGDETYVLRDIAVTDAELEAERTSFAEMLATLPACGNCRPEGET